MTAAVNRIADLLRRCTPAAQDSNHARIRKFEFREDLLEPGQDLAPAQRKVDLCAEWRRGDKFLSAALRLGIPASRVRRDLAELRTMLRARGHAIDRKFSNFEACQLFLEEFARPVEAAGCQEFEVADPEGFADTPIHKGPRVGSSLPLLIREVQARRAARGKAETLPQASAERFAAFLLL